MKPPKKAVTATRVNRVDSSDSDTLKRLIVAQERQITALEKKVNAQTAVIAKCRHVMGDDAVYVEHIDKNTGEVFGVTDLFGG